MYALDNFENIGYSSLANGLSKSVECEKNE